MREVHHISSQPIREYVDENLRLFVIEVELGRFEFDDSNQTVNQTQNQKWTAQTEYGLVT